MTETKSNDGWAIDKEKASQPATKTDLFLIANRNLMMSSAIYRALMALRAGDDEEVLECFATISTMSSEQARALDELIGSFADGE